MLFSSGTLVSKCCHAVIVMEGNEYQCSKCLSRCESDGTLGDLAAPKAERTRLRNAVVEAAKAWSAELFTITSTTYTLDEADRLRRAAHTKLERVVDGLREFEAKQEK